MKHHTLGLSLGLAMAAPGLFLQTQVQAQTTNDRAEDRIEELVIIAHPLSGEGLAQSAEVLQGAELEQKLAGNIGATLAKEPGIHTANFGSNVGRPIIRGLGGPRVRIMEDRIDALDVSVTSADHAVTIEPFIADRIEVLKGPSTLLYGSGAIGGVVDVHTGRIPHAIPDNAITGGVESRYDSNTEGNTTALKLTGGGGSLAWHLDATIKDGDDYEIPGFTESARLRELEEAEHGDEEEHEEEEVQGVLPGSAFESEAFAGGLSYVADWGFIGAAVSTLDGDYGLPGGHEHDEGEEEEEGTPTLDMEQTRVDIELGIEDPFAAIDSLNVRLGVNNYEHIELEPSGEVGSFFENDAWELRAEMVYSTGSWKGAFGVQHQDREFSAIGEEAFVPPVDTVDTGLFWVAERQFDAFSFETGARIGRVDHSPSAGADADFSTYSVSAGAVAPASDAMQFAVNVDVSSRAPVAEELYSDGPHLVTGSYEIGDPNLDNERAFNVSATFDYQGGGWSATASAYYTRFSDFIYQQATGQELDDLPVFQFQQEDATFYGFDAEIDREIATWSNGSFNLRGLVDMITADLDVTGNDNLPRIPPVRFGLGADARFGAFSASLDLFRYAEQDDVAEQELPTDAYTDLRAYVRYDYPVTRGALSIFASGKNLTDDEQRNHTSFIKEFAPAPGRTVELGVRYAF